MGKGGKERLAREEADRWPEEETEIGKGGG